ncbi:DUF4834 family protein [Myroides odoratus]|uniref:DUF4834 domain-containing protein n=1 Tax=Myroides odoratus TaxID=256 RepID=A0A378RKG6_MYROD|nr:DUF4834 family protein [Myroides odoratus]MCS4240020.1 hypothetical protein [Myroides odoratus]MDH6600261.1 hypothetical protein [Myroides gitamensis]QQU05002.1 DUF4834 family protein [Myroides odoratus]STZ27526.1 Uncharacterised protein [Myroides odoratus]
MDIASFGSFLRTLVIIVVIYYAFKFAMRYLFPLFVYKMAKKVERNFQQQQQDFYQQNNRSTQEEPNYTNQSSDGKDKFPRSTKVVGEYIDFEEIEKK